MLGDLLWAGWIDLTVLKIEVSVEKSATKSKLSFQDGCIVRSIPPHAVSPILEALLEQRWSPDERVCLLWGSRAALP